MPRAHLYLKLTFEHPKAHHNTGDHRALTAQLAASPEVAAALAEAGFPEATWEESTLPIELNSARTRTRSVAYAQDQHKARVKAKAEELIAIGNALLKDCQ